VARWGDIERTEPDFARRARARFDAYKHKTLATLRKDGSPRISGIEVEFKDGEVTLGMMPGSLKARDLKRDPRLALHSGTEDPQEKPQEVIDAKLAGTAIEIPGSDHHVFHVDVKEVVVISLGTPADHLVIETWREDDGVTRVKRY
jgi:Pyridoxamine 5'-phosphate oxidase